MTGTRPRAVAALVLASVLLGPAIARADSEDQAAAESLFADARALLREGKVPEACRKFSASYRLDHAAGALLNLALCHEKEGKIASAWAEYKQSVLEARRAGRVEREQVASEAAAALEPRLPKLTVVVPPESRVSGLEVIRNESPIEQGGWGTPLPVDPGAISIVVRAPGYKAWSTSVTIEPAQALSVSVPVLEVDEATAILPPWWTPRRKIGVAIGSAGVVALGVGTYFGIAALHAKQLALNDCPTFDNELRCNSNGSSDSHVAVERAWVSDIALGVGLVSVAAATYLIVSGRPSAPAPADASPPPPQAAKVDVTWMGRVGAGVRLTW
jgi:hypothetical protein